MQGVIAISDVSWMKKYRDFCENRNQVFDHYCQCLPCFTIIIFFSLQKFVLDIFLEEINLVFNQHF